MEFLKVTKDELFKNMRATFNEEDVAVADETLLEYLAKFEKKDGTIDVQAMSRFLDLNSEQM